MKPFLALLALLAFAVAAFAGYCYLQRHPSSLKEAAPRAAATLTRALPAVSPSQTAHWSRVGVGELSFESPAALKPAAPPAIQKGVTLNEAFQAEAGGCAILIHHIRLGQPRDVWSMDRELTAKISQMEHADYDCTASSLLLVAGNRAQQAAFSYTKDGVRWKVNRVTIAKNRDVWGVAVSGLQTNASEPLIFDKMLRSISL